jgi:hypothetical protein
MLDVKWLMFNYLTLTYRSALLFDLSRGTSE